MMKSYYILILSTIILLLSSCNNLSSNHQKNIIKNIQFENKNLLINDLKVISYDSVMIVFPYASAEKIKKIDLMNYTDVESNIQEMKYTDFYYLFLFLKAKKVVALTKIAPNKNISEKFLEHTNPYIIVGRDELAKILL